MGPEQVRRAVLAAAALLFAERGMDAVSLRDIAAKADVHLALIPRYVGSREELVSAVFDYLSERVAEAVVVIDSRSGSAGSASRSVPTLAMPPGS